MKMEQAIAGTSAATYWVMKPHCGYRIGLGSSSPVSINDSSVRSLSDFSAILWLRVRLDTFKFLTQA